MKNISNYDDELDFINSDDFELGRYIYMGMAVDFLGKKRCLSVGYKIDFCYQKAKEFADDFKDMITFTHIKKVKVGQLHEESRVIINHGLLQ